MSRLLVRFPQHDLEVWPARLADMQCSAPRSVSGQLQELITCISYRNLSWIQWWAEDGRSTYPEWERCPCTCCGQRLRCERRCICTCVVVAHELHEKIIRGQSHICVRSPLPSHRTLCHLPVLPSRTRCPGGKQTTCTTRTNKAH